MHSERLPRFREDIEITAITDRGHKELILRDPVQNRSFVLDLKAGRIIAHWQNSKTFSELFEALKHDRISFDKTEFDLLLKKLTTASLLQSPSGDSVWKQQLSLAARPRSLMELLVRRQHLFNPRPLALWLIWKTAAWDERVPLLITGLVFVLGAMMAVPKFSDLLVDFRDFSTVGILKVGVAWIFVKSVHEFAHAFAATRQGAIVPSIGLMWYGPIPVPYTDLADIWRLTGRKNKIAVALAGMKAELLLVSYALLLWSIIPSSTFSDILKYIIIINAISTVFYNANPLVKSDGYYILSDFLNRKNLRSEAYTELVRLLIRCAGLYVAHVAKGNTPPSEKGWLTIFAICCIGYRVFLVITLSLLSRLVPNSGLISDLWVTGVFLFVFLIPTVLEVKVSLRSLNLKIDSRENRIRLILISIIILISAFIPIGSNITNSAVLVASRETAIFPVVGGAVIRPLVTRQTDLTEGAPLLELDDDRLKLSALLAETEISFLSESINAYFSIGNTSKALELQGALLQAKTRLAVIKQLHQRLKTFSPHDGTFLPALSSLHSAYLKADSSLGWIVSNEKHLLMLVEVDEARNIDVGTPVKFFDRSNSVSILANIISVGSAPLDKLPFSELGKAWGGSVTLDPADLEGRVRTSISYVLVRALVNDDVPQMINMRISGLAVIYPPKEFFGAIVLKKIKIGIGYLVNIIF